MPSSINHLFDQIHKLPQVPEVVRDLINQVNNPNVAMIDIGKNIAREQVIAVKILRLVNSAHFGLSRRVASIDEAIALLGMDQLRTLVIASGLVAAIPEISHFDIKRFWRDSFQTATYAKWFAEHAGQPAEIAYTAGLLRNLGSVMIAIAAPRESNEIEQHIKAGANRTETEKRRLGYSGLDVSVELCRRWKFADLLTDTLAQSIVANEQGDHSPLACTVYLAALVSQALSTPSEQTQALEALASTELLNASGLGNDFLSQHMDEVMSMESNMEALLD